ncbi:MAG: prephenate dehydratase [Oscillospiraceae bacterium]|nr:prephenate dehydratase [Oscillospiraceae bacterium]
MKKLGYLGPAGSFSHQAAATYVSKNPDTSPVAYQTIHAMAVAVSTGELDEAILPVENSLEGCVTATMDVLAEDLDFLIRHDLILSIHQHLLVQPGTKRNEITTVLSHVQAIGQCKRYLDEHCPATTIQAVASSSVAAESAANGAGTIAAIGSAVAAEIYGLEILARDIQDEKQNSTRFILIAKADWAYAGSIKTSVIFSVDHAPGSLHRALSIFHVWGINITRIESRPSKRRLGEYLFYIDLEGHRAEQDMQDALRMLERSTPFYKFLGSYNSI